MQMSETKLANHSHKKMRFFSATHPDEYCFTSVVTSYFKIDSILSLSTDGERGLGGMKNDSSNSKVKEKAGLTAA
jgi:hypothetical protein